MKVQRTRLAPSPTGSLHLGNAFSFLCTYALAVQNKWDVVLRIEDIDGPRKKPEHIIETYELLDWLQISWSNKARIQTENLTPSKKLFHNIVSKNLAYHCSLTRSELEHAMSAPHESIKKSTHATRPADVFLHNQISPNTLSNWRFVAELNKTDVKDQISGINSIPYRQDFVIWTKDDMPAYQLAVVADDHDQEITEVVRGNDLLESASWQQQLYAAMGWEIPRWYHLPLIAGHDGNRLAKRHGDTKLTYYKSKGVSAERIIGLIAYWCCVTSKLTPITTLDFINGFDVNLLTMKSIIFTKEQELWLIDS